MPLSKTQYQFYFKKGFRPNQYYLDFEQASLQPEIHPHGGYIPLNWQRTKRIRAHFKPELQWKQCIESCTASKFVLILSEFWCGDASQIVPVITQLLDLNKLIEVRLLFRDENPELIDAHLTHSARAIPKCIVLNSNFEFEWEWGPRPSQAQLLVKELKSNPSTAQNYADRLHKWYAQNRQQDIQQEFCSLWKCC